MFIAPYFEGQAAVDIPLGGLFSLQVSADVASGSLLGVELRPGAAKIAANPGTVSGEFTVTLVAQPDSPFIVLGSEDGSRVELKDATLAIEVVGTFTSPEVRLRLGTSAVRVVVEIAQGDGFLGKIFGDVNVDAHAAVAVLWSSKHGLSFEGAGLLRVDRPIQLQLGPVTIRNVSVALGSSNGATTGELAVSASALLGPVGVVVENIGVEVSAKAVPAGAPRGIFGDLDLDFGFHPPNGVGISVDGGSISGGGFLRFAPGRYSGAIELEAYSISIKAFGLIETKVPGRRLLVRHRDLGGVRTPIQLGFGFTLNGVGGMVGINRTVNSNALRALVRAGRSEELLFPKNLIANAPTIIRDLGTVFPARQGHYVFGPLAKLGWGTPTLITAELGIILEIPGRWCRCCGEVKCLLPKPDVALVKLNLSVGGTLDFPNKTFSLDAPCTTRSSRGTRSLGRWRCGCAGGSSRTSRSSIGGFHPAYQPPTDFPKLQPMALDLGQQGRRASR